MRRELYWGLPMRSYSRTRAWSDQQLDDAKERLRSRGLVDGDGFSDAGRAAREAVETATDVPMQPAIAALGDDLETAVLDARRLGQADPSRRRLPRRRAATTSCGLHRRSNA